jgi:hypothetical protein
MMYCKVNAKSVTKTDTKKPKFVTTAPKVEQVSEQATVKKTRTKREEQTETKE